MARPCFNDHALSPTTCALCAWCMSDTPTGAVYRSIWDEPEPDEDPFDPAKREVYIRRNPLLPLACKHRGNHIDSHNCTSCGGNKIVPIFACALHKKCTESQLVEQHACCRICTDAELPPLMELFPGYEDPLGVPWKPTINGWASTSEVRRQHIMAMRRVCRTCPEPMATSGDGVVVVGGGKFWPGMVVSAQLLRESGCALPIQLWHRGAEESIISEQVQDLPNVTIHDSSAVPVKPRILGGWEAKTVALAYSGFRRALYLDADAYCVKDPKPLFQLLDHSPFVFWRDLIHEEANVKWSAFGMKDSDGVTAVQGGHFLIDMERSWKMFVLTHWFNMHSDYTYQHQKGDQDCWRVALAHLKSPYLLIGDADWEWPAFVCRYEGQPYIVHRCRSKMFMPWMPGGHVTFGAHLPLEQRVHEIYSSLIPKGAKEVFAHIYKEDVWAPNHASGPNSSESAAKAYASIVNGLIAVSGWRSAVDIGCGDGVVASHLQVENYTGIDVYLQHIAMLREKYSDRRWLHMDVDAEREQIPSGDVMLLKDVLMHWPSSLIRDWLRWAVSCHKWKWIVISQDAGQDGDDADCVLGGCRPLNPTLKPLNEFANLHWLCSYHSNKAVCLLPCTP